MKQQPDNTIDGYLARLRTALEVLGPAEADEVVADVRALLRDATADAGGDEAAALVAFGSAEQFAAGVLEERGFLGESPKAPGASTGRRALAVTVDVALWLVLAFLGLAYISLVPVTLTYAFSLQLLTPLIGAPILVGLLGLHTWRMVAGRRRSSAPSVGMRIAGLRCVQVGGERRIVRTRDLAGARRDWRILPLTAAVFALLVISIVAESVAMWVPHTIASTSYMAVYSSSTPVRMVSQLYRSALLGDRGFQPDGTEQAQAAYRALLGRHQRGAFGGYDIVLVELDSNYKDRNVGPPLSDQSSYYVTVNEYRDAAETVAATYRYHVVTKWQKSGPNTADGNTIIDSVELQTN